MRQGQLYDRHFELLQADNPFLEIAGGAGASHAILVISGILQGSFDAKAPYCVEEWVSTWSTRFAWCAAGSSAGFAAN